MSSVILHAGSAPPDCRRLSPLAIDDSWQPLRQSWLKHESQPGFRAGWARVRWQPTHLHYDAIFLGTTHRNRACRLNEPVWELGDACEIFLRSGESPDYIELNVTPENQRLQLVWPPGGVERLRRGEARLEDFCVTRSDWVESKTHLGPGFWTTQVTIPVGRLGLELLTPHSQLYSTVCRYEYDGPVIRALSSTAPLQEPSFHRHEEWPRVVLSPHTAR